MKKFAFLLATILALASAELVQAGGLVAFRSRVVVAPFVQRQVVVSPFLGFRRAVVVDPFVQRQVIVQPFIRQRVAVGFNAGYGVQQFSDGCGVQAFTAGYGVQQLAVVRSRVCQ